MTETNRRVTDAGTLPRVQLRGVKYAAFASQETHCFSATVYIDGVKEGVVENDGHGGSNFYHPHEVQTKLDAVAATLPDVEFGDGQSIKQDADILVGDLMNGWLEMRELKRLCSRKTLFRLKSETYQDGEYRTVKMPWSQQVKDYLVGKYGADLDEILNESRKLI
jgi:hypothetical protein